jgi:membrane-associated phospholipid phosphatase
MLMSVLVAALTLPHGAAPARTTAATAIDTSVARLPARIVGDLRWLGTRAPLFTIAAGGVAALAVHPADHATSHAMSGSNTADEALDGGAIGGNGGVQFAVAGAVYAIGLATHNEKTRQVGSALVEAQAVEGLVTQGLKYAVQRTRPNGGHYSFPSGHSAAVFATAEVLRRHFGWKAGLAAYAGAAYVAASRLSEREHYLSDVVFGAAIGIASAQAVSGRYTSQHLATGLGVAW